MSIFIRVGVAFICSVLCGSFAYAEEAVLAPPMTDAAQQIYKKHGDAVYQVRVIDLVSGKKTAIGSGFQFTKDGYIATNYHVVAEKIQHSSRNRLEYLHDNGTQGALTVVTADVVHDLAILKMETAGGTWVDLGQSRLPKGQKIFSLGNPHDISFTIIEGTYNGYSKKSLIDKIHFSGSLNAGMSGGPTLDKNGNVVGVNVSTAGNQISFLVPVEYLKTLSNDIFLEEEMNFMATADARIEEQLLSSQKQVAYTLLQKEWESVGFGPLMLPGQIHPAFKCWGKTVHEEKDPYRHYASMCSTQERTYLGGHFNTGTIRYRYDYLTADQGKMNVLRFTSLYERLYGLPFGSGKAKEDDVTNFDCHSRIIRRAEQSWKSSFCVRRYKKYPRVYEMQLQMALLNAGLTGLTLSASVEGVSQENALAFAERFIQEIKEKEDVDEAHP